MPTDNTQLNTGTGGNTLRTLADGSSIEWPVAVATYATTVSPGANVLQVVTTSAGLPVAQQGTWTVGVSGTVAATQSGSWTVTANAGTSLNTSALALETGGNLATIAARTPALGQALAAASTPVVLTSAQLATLTPPSTVATTQSGTWNVGITGAVTVAQATAANLLATVVNAGTFAVQSSQSGTWNVGTVTTVSALTAITNPLPAGTNLLGQVAAGQQVASLFNGTTAITPQYAPITASASGPTTIVAAVGGKRVYILRWSLKSNGTVNINWQSHTTTATATGLHYLTQFASDGGAYCPAGIFATAVGEALDLNLSAAVAVGGELTYVQF